MNEKFKELSFDVVLPSHLLVNPNLEPNAKLFYGLVRNLTKAEGYCYASNAYLSDLMQVQVRTVQNWISHLERYGYIEVIDRDGFTSKRKILVSNKFLRDEKKDTPPCKSFHPPHEKTFTHKEDSIKEDRRKGKGAPPQAPSSSFKEAERFYEHLRKGDPKMKAPDLRKWQKDLNYLVEMEGRLWDEIWSLLEWSSSHKYWHCKITSTSSFIKHFPEMLREKNGIARELERSQTVESNKKFTKALVDCSKKKEDVKAEISENGVILNFRQDPKKNGHVMPWGGKFSDPGFRESLIDRLMQVGLEHLLPKIDSILDVKK